jgi:hypothetical protein
MALNEGVGTVFGPKWVSFLWRYNLRTFCRFLEMAQRECNIHRELRFYGLAFGYFGIGVLRYPKLPTQDEPHDD